MAGTYRDPQEARRARYRGLVSLRESLADETERARAVLERSEAIERELGELRMELRARRAARDARRRARTWRSGLIRVHGRLFALVALLVAGASWWVASNLDFETRDEPPRGTVVTYL